MATVTTEQQLAFSGGPPSTSPPAAAAVNVVPLVAAAVAVVPTTDVDGSPADDEDGCAAPFAGVAADVAKEDAVEAPPPTRCEREGLEGKQLTGKNRTN